MNLRAIERWVWYLFVATIAWQTRLILWHADLGFIEWRSMSLYVSDVLMLALFAFAVAGIAQRPRNLLLPGVFLVLAAVSLFNAEQLTVGMYHLIRLAQCIVFFIYLRYWAFRRFDADHTAVAFVVGAVVQATLGIAQYTLQHDVGIRWIGETLLSPSMRGVAVFFDAAHVKVLRAYGTLPHPNVLAAYLTAALGAVGWLWVRHGSPGRRFGLACLPVGTVWPAATAVLLVGLYLTFSRTIIAMCAAAALVVFGIVLVRRISGHWHNHVVVRRRMLAIACTVFVVSVVFVVSMLPQVSARLALSSSDESVQLRLEYARDSLASGSGLLNVNWFGVGIGNFTTWLARTQPNLPAYYVQPAHNLFLLIYSEIGIFGLIALLVWLAYIVRVGWRTHAQQPLVRVALVALLASFCGIALFDHFFWTLQQGRILWWFALALVAGRA